MIAKKLIDQAMKKAQGAQASINQIESTDVSFENDRLKSIKSSQKTHISVKVILNDRIGSSHTTDINDLDGVVARALESAEFGSPAHFKFPSQAKGPDVKVYDRQILPLTKDTMINIGDEMISLVKKYNPEILVHAGVTKGIVQQQFANSAGQSYTTETTKFDVGLHGQLTRGRDILFSWDSLTRKNKDIDHRQIAAKTIHWFKLAEKNVSLKSGTMPVIFTPAGLSVLTLGLRMGLNGKSVLLKSSPLINKLGEKIVDERFSCTDNPLLDYASRSESYDEEGIPHQITPLIENGVVKNFLYDLDTAARAKTKTTGHGIGCGPTNFVVKTGNTSYEEMIKSTKEGLLVHSVLGLGQGNPISGEFSVNVFLGYKIENGQIAGRVKNVMLAGNTYDALKNIDCIGNQAEWVSGALLTPPIKINKLSVIAK